MVADVAERLVELLGDLPRADRRLGRPSRAGSAGAVGCPSATSRSLSSERLAPSMRRGNIEQTKRFVCRAREPAQASSRTPPISLKTAVTPPSSRCSSAITWETALISARWVKAWGKLPRWRPRVGLQLLGEEVEPAGRLEQPLAELAGPPALADLRERRDQPEGADQEGALLAVQAVVGLVDLVAEDEAVLGQVVGDRVDGRPHPRVVGGQEAQQRDQQQSRRRARRCRSAGGRRRRGRRARGSRP